MKQSRGTGHSEDIQIFLLAHLLFFLYEPSGSPGIGFLIFAEEQGTYQRPSEYQAWIYPTSRFRSPEEELFRFHIKHKGMDGRLLHCPVLQMWKFPISTSLLHLHVSNTGWNTAPCLVYQLVDPCNLLTRSFGFLLPILDRGKPNFLCPFAQPFSSATCNAGKGH